MADNTQRQSQQSIDDLNKVLNEAAGSPVVEKKAAAPKKKVSKKSAAAKKLNVTKGRRKMAIARAVLRKGSGRITINKVNVNVIQPEEIRELILEPVKFSSATREIASSSDILVNVYGGGKTGQAQAARTAIAQAIAAAAPSDSVGKEYMKFDRTLMVSDVRQVEPKKFKGPKARARFQKSYR